MKVTLKERRSRAPLTILSYAIVTLTRQGIRTVLGPVTIRNFVKIIRSIPDRDSVLVDVLARSGSS